MKSKTLALVASAALGFGLASSAHAQDAKKQPSWERQKEAEFIARATGETVENTLRQLQLENDIAEQKISIKLREEFKERLTGISIDHKKGSRLIVLLKGDEKVPERTLQVNGNELIVEFRAGHSYTIAEIKHAIDGKIMALDEAFPGIDGLYIEQRTGMVVLHILKDDSNNIEFMTKRAQEILGVPVRIEEISSRTELQAVRGGATINIGCTTGFTVKKKYGTMRGVLSAAHCTGYWVTYHDDNSTQGVFLQSQGESWNASEDVQWYKPHGFGYFSSLVESKFYGVSSTMPTQVTGFITQAGTEAGQRVCHRGITSGFSCGTVVSKEYKLHEPPSQKKCGSSFDPVPCAATWVLVGPLQDTDSTAPDLKCAGGDSGGPWFSGGQAMGVHTAGGKENGVCVRGIYMSIDRIDSLGVELLYPMTE